jgi:hypothetical protein
MRNSYLVNILSNRKRIVKLFPDCKSTKVIKLRRIIEIDVISLCIES